MRSKIKIIYVFTSNTNYIQIQLNENNVIGNLRNTHPNIMNDDWRRDRNTKIRNNDWKGDFMTPRL